MIWRYRQQYEEDSYQTITIRLILLKYAYYVSEDLVWSLGVYVKIIKGSRLGWAEGGQQAKKEKKK